MLYQCSNLECTDHLDCKSQRVHLENKNCQYSCLEDSFCRKVTPDINLVIEVLGDLTCKNFEVNKGETWAIIQISTHVSSDNKLWTLININKPSQMLVLENEELRYLLVASKVINFPK